VAVPEALLAMRTVYMRGGTITSEISREWTMRRDDPYAEGLLASGGDSGRRCRDMASDLEVFLGVRAGNRGCGEVSGIFTAARKRLRVMWTDCRVMIANMKLSADTQMEGKGLPCASPHECPLLATGYSIRDCCRQ
jgi:hypothetical protein